MKRAVRTCPIEKVVGQLGDSCSILILRDLLPGARRFGQLQDSLRGSTRTLATKLKRLEREGFIKRKEYSEKPPRVEYSLTKKGAAFHEVAEAMRRYGKRYL